MSSNGRRNTLKKKYKTKRKISFRDDVGGGGLCHLLSNMILTGPLDDRISGLPQIDAPARISTPQNSKFFFK